MNIKQERVQQAAGLISQALLLLDAAGEREAAAHLQLVQDMIAANGETNPSQPAEPRTLALDPVAVRALGGTFALFAALLERNGTVPRGEVAEILALYATATAEVDQREGDLVACWASMLRDIAQNSRQPPAILTDEAVKLFLAT